MNLAVGDVVHRLKTIDLALGRSQRFAFTFDRFSIENLGDLSKML